MLVCYCFQNPNKPLEYFFFFKFRMESNSCLELLSSHDILTPESEQNIVLHFLKTLQEHKIISLSRYI